MSNNKTVTVTPKACPHCGNTDVLDEIADDGIVKWFLRIYFRVRLAY